MAEVDDTPMSAVSKHMGGRCPKCRSRLPEVAALSHYPCGSCNATVQANQPLSTSYVNKSLSQDNGADREEIPSVPSNMCPETNKENRIFDLYNDGKSPVDTTAVCNASVASGTSSNECTTAKVLRETNTEKYESAIYETVRSNCTLVDQHTPSYVAFQGCCSDLDAGSRHKYPQVENSCRTRGFQGAFLHGDETRDCKSGMRKMQKGSSQGFRFSPYPAEGPPAYHNTHPHQEYHNPDLPDTVERLEKSREELLKKLDELRDQLSKSCELKESTREKVPVVNNSKPVNNLGHRDCSDGFYEGASSTHWPAFHYFPSIDGHEVGLNNAYHNVCDRNRMLVHGEPIGSYPQACIEDPYQVTHVHDHAFNRDVYIANSHGRDAFYCQPACSCSQCFRKHWHMVSQHPQSISIDRRPYATNIHSFYPADYGAFLGGRNCNGRLASSSFLPSHPNIHHRPTLSIRSEQRCHPVAGAAPFIICDNCLDLLLLSHDLLLKKNLQKLRCGSCFHVISLEMNGKQIRAAPPVPKGPKKNTAEDTADDQHPVDTRHTPGVSSATNHSVTEYNSETADKKPSSSYPFNKCEEIMDKECCTGRIVSENSAYPSSPGASNGDLVLRHSNFPSSLETTLECEENLRIRNLPLHEHLRHPSSCGTSLNDTEFDQYVTRPEVAITCNSLENETSLTPDDELKHNSGIDANPLPECDMADNVYRHPDYCEEFSERRREDCHLGKDQGSEQVVTELIKNNFKDTHSSSQSLEKSKRKVSINGYPIPDRLVKKAEKQAGRIYPGDYWYDYKAGFWGVMGRPCIGIIPTFIEEFDYPMPSNCAGGNTNILVNGRELHQKDLELLAGRGLPSSGGRSYLIEISGRVWDAVSGEELDCLGKLAPTIEKLGRGFGMRVLSVD